MTEQSLGSMINGLSETVGMMYGTIAFDGLIETICYSYVLLTEPPATLCACVFATYLDLSTFGLPTCLPTK